MSQNKSEKIKSNFKLFLILASVESTIAFVAALAQPSMERNAWLFGYSATRLLLGIGLLALAILFLLILLFFIKQGKKAGQVLTKALNWLSSNNNFVITATTIIYLGLLSITICCLYFGGITLRLPSRTPHAIIERTLPALLLFIVLVVQGLILLLLPIKNAPKNTSNSIHSVYQTFITITAIILAGFQWLILGLQLEIFHLLPGWFWDFHPKTIDHHDLFFLLTIIITFATAYFVLKKPAPLWRSILILITLGYFLQISFGIMDSQGFESLRLKYTQSHHTSYAAHAGQLSAVDTIAKYEETYGHRMFLGTKPPGLILSYAVAKKTAYTLISADRINDDFSRFMAFISYVFPFISFLVIFFLTRLNSLLHKTTSVTTKLNNATELNPLLPGLLYVTLPNVILIPLFMDQVLYPLLFTVGVLLSYFTIKKQSPIWTILTGLWIYFATFISFSMLPLLPLLLAWITIDCWIYRKSCKPLIILRNLVLVGISILTVHFIMQATVNYNFLTRYQNAFSIHRYLKEYQSSFQQVISNLMLNNLDFASWLGFPIAILALSRAARAVISFFKNTTNDFDSYVLAFSATYAALNIFGQTISEVGRLWLFMAPTLCLFAASEIHLLFKKRNFATFGLIALQLTSMLLLFEFQDFFA